MTDHDLLQLPAGELLHKHPYVSDYFASRALPSPAGHQTLAGYFAALEADRLAELGLDGEALAAQLLDFIRHMERFRRGAARPVGKITLIGGRDKHGRAENVRLEFKRGDVICIVGPTGSGKSRLLADIESMAQGDTPTGRRILIDEAPPDETARLSGEQRLVAQLSQNMNFVMDLTVGEFLTLHAESRLVAGIDAVVRQVFALAADLAGEPFTLETAVTALSGGQSRALMIADVACLSASPIVLIDEIENAGVDRRRALELLVKKEKIVLMATHDPLLALSGDRRLVIAGGGIRKILTTTEQERANRTALEALDRRLMAMREALRAGKTVDFDL